MVKDAIIGFSLGTDEMTGFVYDTDAVMEK